MIVQSAGFLLSISVLGFMIMMKDNLRITSTALALYYWFRLYERIDSE